MKSRLKVKTLRLLGQRAPELALAAMLSSLRALSVDLAKIWLNEGSKDLHWKVIGDALVHFFRNSGPVLTKVGQILATREDLLPPPVCLRLERLYSQQVPMTEKQLKKILNAEFAKINPFKTFDSKALGVGSVGEVHRATLLTGEAVMVKLIRPQSREKIVRDIAVAHSVLNAIFKVVGNKYKSTQTTLTRALHDLEIGFLAELDLRQEARSLDKFRSRMNSHKQIYVPRCYQNFSSKNILVMEEIRGESLASYKQKIHQNPKKAKKIASQALSELLSQIFEDGTFHADPHAGNVMVLEDGRLGLIDFGLTGELSPEHRKAIGRAVRAFLQRDPDILIKSLLSFGEVPKSFDPTKFKNDVVQTVKGHGGIKNTDALVQDLFKVAYRHQVYIPSSTTLLIKTLVTIEGVARSLDPDINTVAVAIPIVLRSLTPKWLRFFSSRS